MHSALGKYFILLRIPVELESVPGTLGAKQEKSPGIGCGCFSGITPSFSAVIQSGYFWLSL